MYDTFSLSPSGDFEVIVAQDRLQYESYGQKPILDFATTPFSADKVHRASPYTKELSDLIGRCMHVEPSRRPTAAELYEITRNAMNRRETDPEGTSLFSVRRRKLYYRGNEINNMSDEEKNCEQKLYPEEYFDLLFSENNDPEEPKLDLEPQMDPYTEQMWEGMSIQEILDVREENSKAWAEAANKKKQFRDHILGNERRMIVGESHIDVLDPDRQLTYDGTAIDQFFIDRREMIEKDRRTVSGVYEGDFHRHRLTGSRGTGHREPALDNRPQRSHQPRFSPFVPQKPLPKAAEDAWVRGSGREHVEHFDPYLLGRPTPPRVDVVGAKSKRKRAVDFFDSPEKQPGADDQGSQEQGGPSKRQRL